MPVMDGFDATRRIREIERVTSGLRGPDTARSRIPIVALTAHALAEVRDRCLQAGMDRYLSKPLEVAKLRAVVDELTAEPESPPCEETPAPNLAAPNQPRG